MQGWIGPAILAAVIAAVVNVVGWFVTFRNSYRMARIRREEKVRDFQVALRAEIRSHRKWLSAFHSDAQTTLVERVAKSTPAEPFTPFVPREVEAFVFDALLPDIHVLPESVIDPVVLYYRQAQVVMKFSQDLRSESFAALDGERKAAIYADYISVGVYCLELAEAAQTAINEALNERAKAQ